MEEIELAGQVILPVGGSMLRVDYINWQNRAWLAPIWLDAPDGKTRIPLRLIAPKYAPGFTAPPGPEVLQIFRQMPLTPHALDQGHVPADLATIVEIVENPPVFLRVSS